MSVHAADPAFAGCDQASFVASLSGRSDLSAAIRRRAVFLSRACFASLSESNLPAGEARFLLIRCGDCGGYEVQMVCRNLVVHLEVSP